MSTEPIVLILSDLHVGGGAADPGDDHVGQGRPLAEFIRQQMQQATPGQPLELIFNGDFLEFAQTRQDAFSLVDAECWCTEAESMVKLEAILAGHPEIFSALAAFAQAGHRVTLVAGNHDVDLYWPAVRRRLAEVIGPTLAFELGQEWIERFDGGLQIAHGHQSDSANAFKHWERPIRTLEFGIERLEMCPGTLFMVKFVNALEAKYPFADNLLPLTKLASVLVREDDQGLSTIGWAMLRFFGSASLGTLTAAQMAKAGHWPHLAEVQGDASRQAEIAAALGELAPAPAVAARWRGPASADGISGELLAEAMVALLGRIPDARWHALFDLRGSPVTLGAGDGVTLGAMGRALFANDKENLRKVAQGRVDATGASVVVMGHTHQPDKWTLEDGLYFNPGSWTRYLELAPGQEVHMADLVDESRFPYQLNYVRVARRADGRLDAAMTTFAEQPGRD